MKHFPILAALLAAAALTACGGGTDEQDQADDNGHVAINPPNCAASGACS